MKCPANDGVCQHECDPDGECEMQRRANQALTHAGSTTPIIDPRRAAKASTGLRSESFVGASEAVRGLFDRPKPLDAFRVYVGGPIDFGPEQVGSGHRSAWLSERDSLVRRLRGAGFEVFAAHEGATKHHETHEHTSAAQSALKHADAMVAFLPPGVVTYGTPIEVYRARREFDIPTMVSGLGREAEEGYHGGSAAINWMGVEYDGEISDPFDWLVHLREHGVRQPVDLGGFGISTAEDGPVPLDSTTVGVDPNWRDKVYLTGSSNDDLDRIGKAMGVLDEQGRAHLPFKMDAGLDWALPKRHYDDDAGLDLYVTESTLVRPGEFRDVPAGCRTALPRGTFGLILGRSSTTRKRGVMVTPGVIDVGWRGHLFVGVFNAGVRMQTIQKGDRIGQVLLLPNLMLGYAPRVETGELPEHERGERGFGSTGGINGGKTE